MAHFIKLTDGIGEYPVRYVNIDQIVDFYVTQTRGTVVTTLAPESNGSSSCVYVQETPDQILALIAEAQGAK